MTDCKQGCQGSATQCPKVEPPFDFCRCDCHEARNWCQGFCRTCGTSCAEYCEEIESLNKEKLNSCEAAEWKSPTKPETSEVERLRAENAKLWEVFQAAKVILLDTIPAGVSEYVITDGARLNLLKALRKLDAQTPPTSASDEEESLNPTAEGGRDVEKKPTFQDKLENAVREFILPTQKCPHKWKFFDDAMLGPVEVCLLCPASRRVPLKSPPSSDSEAREVEPPSRKVDR